MTVSNEFPDPRCMTANETLDQTEKSNSSKLLKFVLLLGSWTVLVVAYLLVAGRFTTRSVFFGMFVGHLVLVELTTTNDPADERHWLLRWSVRVGYLLTGYFIYNDIFDIVTLG